MNKIGITMGDPAGIGPEVVCKALNVMSAEERAGVLVIGDQLFMNRARDLIDADFHFSTDATPPKGAVPLLQVDAPNAKDIRDGEIQPDAGEAACRCVKKAVDLALAGEIDVVCTASLHKTALRDAGYNLSGHAGLLKLFTGVKKNFAVLAGPKLSVIHVSTHVSLADAAKYCTTETVLETIRVANEHVKTTGIAKPRVAVAGLNPHCGENGHYGSEDDDYVVPAVAAAREEGIDTYGPIPGDLVFEQAIAGRYDIVVAQYHDQGHIPAKLIGGHECVNITAGLPILRTSVDHGTAFDIAWKGVADPGNMQAAIAMARKMKPIKQA
ncbi:4-hydroxythreonine-4-phosphate dehydrogenase [Cohaesibacter sp. ES.047]|uniref:4-hydroxythreonine-4-phosphate dehydrogenase PdxA n=1 Tax=Cohaesibacter sp. ES.047 TaxID=1798205 RepID=UPI000BC0737B|nr:4-hydroxythreonine-4-phosphate dehydrogenase PdxA [Cohaesibacter sp. ES.047]SNY93464.1 4-hydroxythreonine-4-phosphate dehydrogenase [Cohaesibacter sp. ES.047]